MNKSITRIRLIIYSFVIAVFSFSFVATDDVVFYKAPIANDVMKHIEFYYLKTLKNIFSTDLYVFFYLTE